MKILVYGINFFPELTGCGKYTGEMADWLARTGFDVRVVTAPPYYPDWKVADGYSGRRYTCERVGQVNVWRCPLWVPRQANAMKRVLHLASFAASSLPVMVSQIFWRPDVVVVVAPTILCAPSGWVVARSSGAKAWLHVQDFELDIALGSRRRAGGILRRLAVWVERTVLRRFDVVSTISARMLDRLAEKGVSRDARVSLPNWVDTAFIRPLGGGNRFRQQLGIDTSQKVVLYAGNMGEKQGLELVAEVARSLSHRPDIVIVLAGAGAARARIEAETADCPNVRWLPLQPLEALNELLNMADVHLLPQRADAADLVMPSKLTGMLASGRPVVATAAAGTQLEEVVRECGLVVEPGAARAVADAITELADAPEMRARLGKAARRFACEWLAREVVLGRLTDRLNAISRE